MTAPHFETLEYRDGTQTFEAYLSHPKASPGKKPAVLIFHAWAGRDEFACKKANALAELGYVGIAMDLYGKGVVGKSPEENSKLMTPYIQDRQLLKRRMLLGIESVLQNPSIDQNRVAAVGFCFGGLCVLDLARSGAKIRGVVSFHGLLGSPPSREKTSIPAKLLVLHGHDDPMVPPSLVQDFETEMTEAQADWQIHTYGKTTHAFTNPIARDPAAGMAYSEIADRRSWLAMKNFLEEIFSF